MAKVSVLGAGSWGTALAVMLHGNHHQVTLWSALSDEVAQLRRDREQKGKLPGVHIPEDINITDCLEEAVKDREMLVLAVPSVFVRERRDSFPVWCRRDSSSSVWQRVWRKIRS